MNQFKVGDVKITRIIESEAPWPGTWLLPDATLENVRKRPTGSTRLFLTRRENCG